MCQGARYRDSEALGPPSLEGGARARDSLALGPPSLEGGARAGVQARYYW